ncbi:hypothetical protein CANCADRAFT_144753 [Tortispora caseinolytica NRRL Y-17796]|uniref:Uncharacterized protein n=1 Tax=Tortispora caseinolytica NRRL Y-17796 TaxID=767744 RepID=A0A1E4T983_9ASCO|nr:hypothetical protein CANCADRAFT_144753 [Tortispora caseinolytica NRRL Y-17796]
MHQDNRIKNLESPIQGSRKKEVVLIRDLLFNSRGADWSKQFRIFHIFMIQKISEYESNTPHSLPMHHFP